MRTDRDPSGQSRRIVWQAGLMMAIVGGLAIAYLPALPFPFCNLDDHDYVAGNPTVLGGLSLAGVVQAFGFDLWLYHPLTIVSLMIDGEVASGIEKLFGIVPPPDASQRVVLRAVCRSHNLLLHVVNTGLVMILASALLGSRWRGIAAAALFGLHPLRVEAVVWICERKELLAACFGLVAVLSYLQYAKGGGRGWYGAAVTAAACSLLSKPMFVTLPGLLLLLDLWPTARIPSALTGGRLSWSDLRDWKTSGLFRCLADKIPFLILSLACTATTLLTIRQGLVDVGRVSLLHRLETAAIGYATYPLLDLVPWSLAVLYPLRQTWSPARVWGSAAVCAAITIVVLALRRRLPAVWLGWFWYLLATIPISGLIQNGQQAYADRFHYVPGIGLTIAVVAVAVAVADRCRWPTWLLPMGGVGAALALWSLTCSQVQVWQSGETLWRRAVQAVPNNWYALDQYARQLQKRGRYAEAASCWERCHAGLAHRLRYACNLAELFAAAGDASRANEWRSRAIAEPRRTAADCAAIARVEMAFGNRGQAIFAFRQALSLAPGDSSLLVALGRAYEADGQSDEAARCFGAAGASGEPAERVEP